MFRNFCYCVEYLLEFLSPLFFMHSLLILYKINAYYIQAYEYLSMQLMCRRMGVVFVYEKPGVELVRGT